MGPTAVLRATVQPSMLPSGATPKAETRLLSAKSVATTLRGEQCSTLGGTNDCSSPGGTSLAAENPTRLTGTELQYFSLEFGNCEVGLQIRAIDIYEK
jgi:hypothetical protein